MEKTAKVIDGKNDYYKDKEYDFYFYHDFDSSMPFDEVYNNVKNKYKRRIERFYDHIQTSNDILFVWWSRDKHQNEETISKSYKRLTEKFPNKNINILLIEPSEEKEEKYYENNHVLVLRYDNISYDVTNPKKETMGNQKNNLKVFAQIKRRMKIEDIKVILLVNINKFFIGFIPNKEYRHKLKREIEFKFYRNKL